MGPVWGAPVLGGLVGGFDVGLDEGGGGGAVGPVCDCGLLLGFAPVFLGEGALDGAREDVAGGGGRAVRRSPAPGGVALRVRRGVCSDPGGGGGDSTPADTLEGEGFGLRWLVGVWIAAGLPDPPEGESGHANQMPAPAATSRASPTMMGPRRS